MICLWRQISVSDRGEERKADAVSLKGYRAQYISLSMSPRYHSHGKSRDMGWCHPDSIVVGSPSVVPCWRWLSGA